MFDLISELPDFSNRCRLFPLPDIVLFPHALLPLHIFEPRYCQMTEDALADDQLVTMVQIRAAAKKSPWIEPIAIEDVGCVGKIVQHERLSNGRFNLLLLGCKRVRLKCEVKTSKLYRIAEAEIIDDLEPGESGDSLRVELIDLFRVVLRDRHRLDDDLEHLLKSSIPLGTLSDIIAHSLGLKSEMKQSLLAEPKVDHRARTLQSILRKLVEDDALTRPFPPPFSVN